MKDMNDKNLDGLLKISLSTEILVDEKLNEELIKKIKGKDGEKKTISIWWLPMVLSIISSVILFSIGTLYIPKGLLQIGIFILGLQGVIFSVVLTVIGLKYFNLREGAMICL